MNNPLDTAMKLFEILPSSQTSALLGLVVGLLFGIFAQQSQFCLRAACIEFWRKNPSSKFIIWLLAFSSALILTQAFIELGLVSTSDIRQLTSVGSMSGAIIGGALFGAGMILARGCASRLLVLSATGNMRALVSGLVVTIVAQASLRGVLSPARKEISTIWLVQAHERGFSHLLPDYGGIIFGGLILGIAFYLQKKIRLTKKAIITSLVTGSCISLGWLLTSLHADNSFDIVAIKSISFTGPSADTLMSLINSPTINMTFDIGLVPGVFIGSLMAALVTKQFKWQQFTQETKQARYLIGASMMGFGSMLAGGCAVGAGVTGGAILALTAWVALLFMWLSAGITDWLIDRGE